MKVPCAKEKKKKNDSKYTVWEQKKSTGENH